MFDGNLIIESEKWYYLLLAIDQDARFVAQVWERDNLAQNAEFRKGFEQAWAECKWELWFGIQAGEGKLYVDSYTEISFSEMR